MSTPHAGQVERFLGKDQLAFFTERMHGWYGPPIALTMPGRNQLKIHADGDISGKIVDGRAATLLDFLEDHSRRVFRRWSDKQQRQLNAGFTSVSDFISEVMYVGKRRSFSFSKVTTAGATGFAQSTWRQGANPAAAGAASNPPGGDALTSSSAGAINFQNDVALSGEREYFIGAAVGGYGANNYGLMLYDRLFQANKTMNSTTAESVTGVPTRYQTTTSGAEDSAEGNFVFPEIQTVLPATAHNWTVCQYTNQANTGAQSIPSVTGVSSGPVNTLDMAVASGGWFMPLAAGDTGVLKLTQLQCSALVATGVVAFVIGHPIAWLPAPLINVLSVFGGLNYNFAFTRIFDNACLALLEPPKFGTSAGTWAGSIYTARG
jgi:hypothetical protein